MTLRRAVAWLLALCAVPLLAEAAARLAGGADIPVWEADARIGYLPRPSQAGSFLHRKPWSINALGMAAPEFAPGAAADVVLLGDSIVFGGQPFGDRRALGPHLREALGTPVWPVAAGSWSLLNELTYLEDRPQVVQGGDRFVFVLNSEDFGAASSWSCGLEHPLQRPPSALLHLVKRYVRNWEWCVETPLALRVPPRDWRPPFAALAAQLRAADKPLLVFLHATREEAADAALRARRLESVAAALHEAGQGWPVVYSVARDPRWRVDHYVDFIHPGADGAAMLAQIIARPDPATRLTAP